jgi:hypothetical protein
VNVNLIVIFKCVSLKYLNINISARAASVAVSGGHTGERRACLCVCLNSVLFPYTKCTPSSKKAVLLSSGADISSKGMCVSG